MNDDVDNVIRGVDYGFSTSVVGALKQPHDIQPGESATHVKVFSLPPPKTRSLTLSIDLACLGQEGSVEYQIPMEQVQKRN